MRPKIARRPDLQRTSERHGVEAGDDSDSKVPRAVRAFLRVVALYFITTGALAALAGAAIALGILDPTALMEDGEATGARSDLQARIESLASIPMIAGTLSLAFGAALYAASRRLADVIAR